MVHRCQMCGEEHGTHDAAWKHVRYVHPEIRRRDINTKVEEVVRSPDGTEIINRSGQGGEHGQESRHSRARQPLFQIALPGLFIAMVLLVVPSHGERRRDGDDPAASCDACAPMEWVIWCRSSGR